MNLRRETAKMDVPPGNPQGLAPEAYLKSTSQRAGPEDAGKDAHIHGGSSRLVNYPG